MTKTATNGVIALVAIAVLAVGSYYLFGHKVPNSGDMAPREGAVSQTDLSQATKSLKSAVEAAGGAQYDFSAQPTYGGYANFGIVQQVNEVKSVGLVDEMALKFRGATDNEYAEVDPKTNQVVAFHREVDYTGNAKTSAELEQQVRAFLAKVYPNFAQVESTLTFENNSKTGRPEGSNLFFTWNDMGYASELPNGAEAERAPFIQVGIASNGYIFSYNNTIDLYRNALKEFNLTQ
ncbi:MAG: hypothetical protein KBD50_00375 [Candidatus Pacebacteria bacterium]|nr:hypothetical protein [Candidatus Paceibacterota bacterium]